MPQNGSCRQFGVGITEEERIHCGFCQHGARCLYLHGIPGVRNDASRAAHHHAQRFKIVDQAAPPVRGPIASKLRRVLPECFILAAVSAFRPYNLPDALLPVLQRLILRNPTRQRRIYNTGGWRRAAQYEGTGQGQRTQLPAAPLLSLRDVRRVETRALRPGRDVVERYAKSHCLPGERTAAGGAAPMRKDIALAGNTQHGIALLALLQRVEPMFPQAAGVRVMRVLVYEITGDGLRRGRSRREGEDAAEGMLMR